MLALELLYFLVFFFEIELYGSWSDLGDEIVVAEVAVHARAPREDLAILSESQGEVFRDLDVLDGLQVILLVLDLVILDVEVNFLGSLLFFV